MFNISSIIPSISDHSSEKITRSIKRGLIGADEPTYEGKKITKRTTTNLSHVRKQNEWKNEFERREEQKRQGLFSHKLQPYQELGQTELDTKKLILDAMKNIGAVFQMENMYDTAYKKSHKELQADKDSAQKKGPKTKRTRKTSLYRRPERIESGDSGSTTIQELLDKADKRITFLKAGRPLIHCIDVEAQLSRENRYKEKTGKIKEMMETPEAPKTDEETEIMNCENADERTRKRFLAKLESLKTLFCCVINMRNRDLKNMTPLSREMLRSISKGVIQEYTQFGDVPLGPRSSAIPGVILAANRTHRLGRLSVFNECESEYMPSNSLFKVSSAAASYADMPSSVSKSRLSLVPSGMNIGSLQSSTSKCQLYQETFALPSSFMRSSISKGRFNREESGMPNGGMRSSLTKGGLNREVSGLRYGGMRSSISKGRVSNTESTGKRSVTFLNSGKNWSNKSSSRMSHLLQVPPGGATQIDSWHDLMAHQPEDSKLDRILESEGAKPIKGICKSKALKSRRGAIFQGKGDVDLPIWQKIIQEKVKRKEIRFGRPQEITKKKKMEDVESMPQKKRDAFEKLKSKNVDKFRKELDTRIDCFRQRLEYLHVSMFKEEDIRNMRQKVRHFQKESDLDNDCPAGWYEALCAKQRSLSLEDDEEVSSKLKDLLQFTRIEITCIPHLRARLCLLVMSLPVYEVCLDSTQAALKFFMVSVMDISETCLEDWMLHRKLWVNNNID